MNDDLIRMAAFNWLKEQVEIFGEVLPWSLLTNGFVFNDQRIHLVGQPGIWKPQVMQLPLSIRTSYGGPYPDKLNKDGRIEYRFRGTNPNNWDNVGLRKVMEQHLPLVYFFGVSPGKYFVLFPAFITHADNARLVFTVQADEMGTLASPSGVEDSTSILYRRAYITTSAKIRIHQQGFRIRVLEAYRSQCTLCRLKHPELLDAAHIIGDNEDLGDPIVQNGLSMCKIHHAAFDRNIIGINPAYQIHVRKDILEETDGPMLKYGLQSLENQKIILPGHRSEYPDRDRLDQRFDRFLKAS
jgi:putative restriction endonuclease